MYSPSLLMMMTDMTGPATDIARALFLLIHMSGVIAFAAGVLFLIIWGAKTLTTKQLKVWGLSLAIIGLILCIVTLSIGAGIGHARSTNIMMKAGDTHMMGNGMMMNDDDMMMKLNEKDDDAMSMSMNDMSGMLTGKTGDAFDQAFLEGMIPHHQGAIDMAKLALTNAKHQEIRDMATAIISAQQREIDQMNAWMKAWGYTK